MKIFFTLLLIIGMAGAAWADVFDIQAGVRASGVYPALLMVSARVPPGHVLYADDFKVDSVPPVPMTAVSVPEPALILDAFSGAFKPAYTADFTAVYALEALPVDGRITARVSFMGCDEFICFLPQTREFDLQLPAAAPGAHVSGVLSDDAAPADAALVSSRPVSDWPKLLDRFDVRIVRSGYMAVPAFLEFLDAADHAPTAAGADARPAPTQKFWWLALLVLAGGIALNLTPCVLPMIPINLAIIGAGARPAEGTGVPDRAARRRGFLLGCLYGVGMTLAYGILGVLVVLTGAFFGGINASPVFNFGVAVLFLVLALAMFDVIVLDFSRWQSRLAFSHGGRLAVLLMGAVSAILAGACVAPVVITVLTQSLILYTGGHLVAGLILPFVLGLGMALPWPLAGAGLAALPRPGRWMQWVKRVMGILILAVAVYYAWQGWNLLPARAAAVAARHDQAAQAEGWLTSLPEALARSEQSGRPLLIDFWATWCKNCTAMDATTLRHPEVLRRLQSLERLKYQAERPDQPPTRDVLAAFNVVGLPTFVILIPHNNP